MFCVCVFNTPMHSMALYEFKDPKRVSVSLNIGCLYVFAIANEEKEIECPHTITVYCLLPLYFNLNKKCFAPPSWEFASLYLIFMSHDFY